MLFFAGYTTPYEMMCIPIVARCNTPWITTTHLYLNGVIVSWTESQPSMHYNISYNETSNSFSICLSNVTEKSTVFELLCYVPATSQCLQCTRTSGRDILLLSRAMIIPANQGMCTKKQ